MKKFTLISAVAALAMAGVAAADDRGVPGVDVDVNASTNMKAPMVDKNSDGKITRAEASANSQLAAQFDKLDTNKDGSLDKGEFAKFEGKGKMRTPGNKDGAPGLDEGAGDERSQSTDRPDTTDDSTPGNKDKLGPGR